MQTFRIIAIASKFLISFTLMKRPHESLVYFWMALLEALIYRIQNIIPALIYSVFT